MAAGLPDRRDRRGSSRHRPRFAGHFTVYVTSRRPGLASGATMAGIAADYARAIEDGIGGPVAFHGTSAGGAVAVIFPGKGHLHASACPAAASIGPGFLLAG